MAVRTSSGNRAPVIRAHTMPVTPRSSPPKPSTPSQRKSSSPPAPTSQTADSPKRVPHLALAIPKSVVGNRVIPRAASAIVMSARAKSDPSIA
jgi:hypothetical protein